MAVSKKRKLSKKKLKSISKKRNEKNRSLKPVRDQLYDIFSKDLLDILDERIDYLNNIRISSDLSVLDFTKSLNTSNVGLYQSLQIFKEYTDNKVSVVKPDTYEIIPAKKFFGNRYTRMVGNFLFTILDIQFDTCFSKALSYIGTLNVTKDNILDLIEEAKIARGIGEYAFIRAMVFTHYNLLLEVGFDIESFRVCFAIPSYLQLEELLFGNEYGVLQHMSILSKELNELLATLDTNTNEDTDKDAEEVSVEEETFVGDVEKVEFKYIDSYLKLNKLAESKGFVKIRSNGDHAIFRDNSGKTVVIPQGRSIGKGLSFTIQNSIY